jgi:antitoxin MazE
MTAKIIAIGNSKGIRIPNNILKSLKIDSEVDLIIDEDRKEILIRSQQKSRQGWDSVFKKMNTNGDDKLLIDDTVDLDDSDWKW